MEVHTRLVGIVVVDYLEARDYRAVMEVLENRYNQTLDNISNELPLFLELDHLSKTEKNLDKYLNEFVGSFPRAHLAYLARGYYPVGKSNAARGSAWRHQTKPEQIEKMLEIQRIATNDFEKTLRKSADNYLAHIGLASVYKTRRGDFVRISEHFDEAKRLQPARYWLWSELLWGTTLRWGGSYTKMEKAIEEMKVHFTENGKLASLQGDILYDHGNLSEHSKKYNLAKGQFAKALGYGDNQKYSLALGRVNVQLRLYGDGCPMIREAALQRPYRKESNQFLSICEKKGF